MVYLEMDYINYNGRVSKNGSTVISANNRGFKYGDGLFETLKSKDYNLQFFNDHFLRLKKGMKLLQFDFQNHFSQEFLHKQIVELLKKNGHHNTARIRVTVFRSDGGLYDEINHEPNYLIQSWALPDNSGTMNINGLVLGIYPDIKKSCDILSNIKHNNFLPYALAAMYAKKHKWNDAVLLNTKGRICDTTIANVFIIRNEVIYTPALQEGCIEGVIRKKLINFLKAKKYKIIEGKISVEDLLNADEIFLTNSIFDMQWVQRSGEKRYTKTISEKIYAGFFSEKI